MNIAIVGGGIGGLTTALALKQSGVKTTIYESAPEIKPVGAGILLASNAMQVFEKLGVRKKIEQAGHKISRIKITNAKLKTLSDTSLAKLESKYGVYNLAIHRADLQKALAEAVGYPNIRLSKRAVEITYNQDYEIAFADGTTAHHGIIIAADGIHSMVRDRILGKGTMRDSKQRCWRGITAFSEAEKYSHQAFEAWGAGKRFGFTKISDDMVYWYAVINAHLIKPHKNVAELFKDFHPDIVKMISSTSTDHIIYTDLADLKPINQWQCKTVCLIGDAAHATTPNLGQGACQAIEDAYVLGELFKRDKNVESIFNAYENLRMKKARFIVKTSWRIGKLAQMENKVMMGLRNTVLSALPNSFNLKQMEKVADITYPSL